MDRFVAVRTYDRSAISRSRSSDRAAIHPILSKRIAVVPEKISQYSPLLPFPHLSVNGTIQFLTSLSRRQSSFSILGGSAASSSYFFQNFSSRVSAFNISLDLPVRTKCMSARSNHCRFRKNQIPENAGSNAGSVRTKVRKDPNAGSNGCFSEQSPTYPSIPFSAKSPLHTASTACTKELSALAPFLTKSSEWFYNFFRMILTLFN